MLEPKKDSVFIGIDPGVNFGLTVITGRLVYMANGKLPRQEYAWNHGVDAYDFVKNEIIEYGHEFPAWAVVEGAAYRDKFGQVGLESVRFGFYLGLLHRNVITKIMAPATIRASVLGGGKNTAFDRWPLLNHNAADSLGCALAAYSLVQNENS